MKLVEKLALDHIQPRGLYFESHAPTFEAGFRAAIEQVGDILGYHCNHNQANCEYCIDAVERLSSQELK